MACVPNLYNPCNPCDIPVCPPFPCGPVYQPCIPKPYPVVQQCPPSAQCPTLAWDIFRFPIINIPGISISEVYTANLNATTSVIAVSTAGPVVTFTINLSSVRCRVASLEGVATITYIDATGTVPLIRTVSVSLAISPLTSTSVTATGTLTYPLVTLGDSTTLQLLSTNTDATVSLRFVCASGC